MSSTGKVRAHELVSKNKADLTKQLGELKQELLSLRVQKVAGGSAAKLTKMCVPARSGCRCRGLWLAGSAQDAECALSRSVRGVGQQGGMERAGLLARRDQPG